MKTLKLTLLSIVAVGLVFSVAYAGKHLPEERGKALFENPKFAGGIKSCSECHPGGRGLEKAYGKKEFRVMGRVFKSLEDVNNFCIEMGNKGKAIDPKSKQMKDLVAYIKTLKDKAPAPAPGY